MDKYNRTGHPYLPMTPDSIRLWSWLNRRSSSLFSTGKINYAKRAQQRHAQKKRVANNRAKAKRIRKQKQRQRRNNR